jgi:NADP-dependent 3-hydroxy acid dehydrogenase YdfG
MAARRKDRLEALAAELGDRAVPLAVDVTDLTALEAAIGSAAEQLGGLDGVVAVAGKSMTGTITTGTPERWRELVDLNLIGPLATVRYAIGHFPETGRRDIVFVASAGAITPLAGVGIYAASKRGLRAAFDAMRIELAPAGINVSLVMPGMFETEGLSMEGVVFDGDIPELMAPVFTEGTGPAPVEPLADSIAFLLGLPDGVCINELVIRPTGELNP